MLTSWNGESCKKFLKKRTSKISCRIHLTYAMFLLSFTFFHVNECACFFSSISWDGKAFFQPFMKERKKTFNMLFLYANNSKFYFLQAAIYFRRERNRIMCRFLFFYLLFHAGKSAQWDVFACCVKFDLWRLPRIDWMSNVGSINSKILSWMTAKLIKSIFCDIKSDSRCLILPNIILFHCLPHNMAKEQWRNFLFVAARAFIYSP